MLEKKKNKPLREILLPNLYCRHPEAGQVRRRDAFHIVRVQHWQSFVHTSNSILPLAHYPCALHRVDTDNTYPYWGSSQQTKAYLLQPAVSCDLQTMSWLLWPAASGNVSERRDGVWGTAKPLRRQQAHVKSKQISSLQLLPELPFSSPAPLDDMACLRWAYLPLLQVPCSARVPVWQRPVYGNEGPLTQRTSVTLHFPCKVTGKLCMWQREVCCGSQIARGRWN